MKEFQKNMEPIGMKRDQYSLCLYNRRCMISNRRNS